MDVKFGVICIAMEVKAMMDGMYEENEEKRSKNRTLGNTVCVRQGSCNRLNNMHDVNVFTMIGASDNKTS